MSAPIAHRRSARRHRGAPSVMPSAALVAFGVGTSLMAGVAAAAVEPRLAVVVAGLLVAVLTGLASASTSGVRTVAALLVAATFVTRFRVDIGGFGFRPEHALMVVLLVALAANGQATRWFWVAQRRPFLWFAAYICWSAAVGAVAAPSPPASVAIAGWLGMDWLIAVSLVTAFWDDGWNLERFGLRCAAIAFAVALGLWVTHFFAGTTFGLQYEFVTGQQSLYGLSYEANLLGSTAALWVLIAITARRPYLTRATPWVAGLGTVVLLLSYTRAAAVALVLGLAVVAITDSRRNRRRLIGRLSIAAAFIAILGFAMPNVSGPIVEKLGQVTEFSESTGENRADSVDVALDDLSASPANWLVGFGPNTFGQRHAEASKPGDNAAGYLGVFPVEVVYGAGLIGAGLLMGLLLSLRPGRMRSPARAFGCITVFFVASLATSPFWLGATWILVALGVLSSFGRTRVPT